MEVETFEQTEAGATGSELSHSEEALKLIEELKLKGQTELTAHDGITRIPYREMNAVEERVYKTLFPVSVRVEEYSQSMIPLRVLQVIAHAQSLDCYKYINIWSEEARPTDPIVVGVMKSAKGSWRDVQHILARWGTALEPFDVLYEKAVKVLCRKFSADAKISKAEAQRVIDQTEPTAINFLDSGISPIYR